MHLRDIVCINLYIEFILTILMFNIFEGTHIKICLYLILSSDKSVIIYFNIINL